MKKIIVFLILFPVISWGAATKTYTPAKTYTPTKTATANSVVTATATQTPALSLAVMTKPSALASITNTATINLPIVVHSVLFFGDLTITEIEGGRIYTTAEKGEKLVFPISTEFFCLTKTATVRP